MGSLDAVCCAVLVNREVFIGTSLSKPLAGASVASGGQATHLEEVTEIPFDLGQLGIGGDFLYSSGRIGLKEQSFDGQPVNLGSEIYVNRLDDWKLENGTTLQIRVGSPEEPRFIHINKALKIDNSDGNKKFRALIAAHRCDAELIVRFELEGEHQAKEIVVPFRNNFVGGHRESDYQEVNVPVPFKGRMIKTTTLIRYSSFRSEGGADDTYLFIANAHVSTSAPVGIVKPRLNVFSKSSTRSWFRARVPNLRASDGSLSLVNGSDEISLFKMDSNDVTLMQDWGHGLSLKAATPQAMLLYIDNEPIEEIRLTEAETYVRLPVQNLRGEIIDVSIRDLSGSQVFLRVPVLAPRILTQHDIMARESRGPIPTDLTVRANHRYQAVRAHLENPITGMCSKSLASALRTLDQTYESLKLNHISFPKMAKPKVSVIIPVHNKIEVTYYALCALLVAHNSVSFEVIVVDDGSTDQTVELESLVSGITVIRNSEPQRFIRACNAGASKARGEYIVLLNNDTEPTVGWLDALVNAFNRFDNVGLAGSRLLYPDGRLQEAGGIVWSTGNPWNYGHGENPWEPRFSYARQADYLSGAAMMTTKEIWNKVGGLSSYLEPMYFEDTDFAFKVREAGFETWYVPASIVYHFEGITSGTDTSSGFKRFQEVNRPKFKRQWARAYSKFGKEAEKPDLEKDRGIVGRVLFVDYSTPREDRDAGSYAALSEIELIQSLGYKVTFLPQNLAHLGEYTDRLQRRGVECIISPFYLSLPEFFERRGAEFDAVYITRYYVAQDTIPHIRKHAPNAKILFNNADLHFLRELRAAISTNDPTRLAAVQSIREQELAMMKAADVVLSYNEVEHSVIASHTDGQARVMTCPWVVDIPDSVPPLGARRGLSFLGSFKHHPNAEGVKWFCSTVMPLLDGAGAHLTIYGAGMDDAIKALASDTIDPVGFVEDIADAYDRHRIFVAPLLSGAGIKGKVLSAIAHGIPTVLTPVAAEGIGLRHGHDCLIAERPEDWAAAITRLLSEDKLWASISEAARAYAAERFSFAEGRAKMREAFEAVDLFGAV